MNHPRRLALSPPLLKLGRCRGTGVRRPVGTAWKIEQYHPAIPLPDELADASVKRIRAGK